MSEVRALFTMTVSIAFALGIVLPPALLVRLRYERLWGERFDEAVAASIVVIALSVYIVLSTTCARIARRRYLRRETQAPTVTIASKRKTK